MKTFDSLDLIEPLLRAVRETGYTSPTPIQQNAIPKLLEGRDLLGIAQTGTGKTAAFALPVLQRMVASAGPSPKHVIRTLVLAPTRELAAQIGESFESYGAHLSFRTKVIFGGVGQEPQVRALRGGIDILVATPGRLLDLHNQGHIDFSNVRFLVLDEADRMLDMGFIHDMRKIRALVPKERQTLLFSATMPPDVAQLAADFLRDPVRVEVTPPATTVERIDQQVMFVDKGNKLQLLVHLLGNAVLDRAIVFTRTKHGANRLADQLSKAGFPAAAIHGNKSQGAREKALDGFRAGTLPVLVATDLASRGLDVDGVSHVFNYELSNEPDSYVHRIGRTGRAGRAGLAIALCEAAEAEYFHDIERTTGAQMTEVVDHPWHDPRAKAAVDARRRGVRSADPEAPHRVAARLREEQAKARRAAGQIRGGPLRSPAAGGGASGGGGSGGGRAPQGGGGPRSGQGGGGQRPAQGGGGQRAAHEPGRVVAPSHRPVAPASRPQSSQTPSGGQQPGAQGEGGKRRRRRRRGGGGGAKAGGSAA